MQLIKGRLMRINIGMGLEYNSLTTVESMKDHGKMISAMERVTKCIRQADTTRESFL